MKRKMVWVIFAIILLMGGLSTLDRDNLLRIIARLTDRIAKMERILNGAPISQVRIADLSADKITTGILTLKDGTEKAMLRVLDPGNNEITTLDLNGLTIKDSAGNVLATLNPDGLQVNGGNVIIRNGDDERVLDALGIVSQTNFTNDEIEATPGQVITSSTNTDVTDSEFTTDNFPRTRTVLIMMTTKTFFASVAGGDFAGDLTVEMALDDVVIPGNVSYRAFDIGGDSSCIDEITMTAFNIQEIPAGIHSIKLKARVNQTGPGNSKYTIGAFRFAYVVLGT